MTSLDDCRVSGLPYHLHIHINICGKYHTCVQRTARESREPHHDEEYPHVLMGCQEGIGQSKDGRIREQDEVFVPVSESVK